MSRTNPARVLIVEDDLGLKTIMSRILRQIQPEHLVDWAMSAEKALSFIEDRAKDYDTFYDLVIADIGLPGRISGIDLWRRFRREHPTTGFIFSSAMPVDCFLRTIGNDICPPFLTKPFSPGECKQVVQGMLSYRNGPPT